MGDDILKQVFQDKRILLEQLVPFGFIKIEQGFLYRRELTGTGLQVEIFVDFEGNITATVIDPALGEPYTLHLVKSASGSFVGKVRELYEQILREIGRQCCETEIFHGIQAKSLIEYVRNTYGNELEFLWDKFPKSAIWRRSDNQKWYGSMNRISMRKLGVSADLCVETVNLCETPEIIQNLIDSKAYFPAYHMNKKHWYTLLLDGTVDLEEVCDRVDRSYQLAKKKG